MLEASAWKSLDMKTTMSQLSIKAKYQPGEVSHNTSSTRVKPISRDLEAKISTIKELIATTS